MLAHIDQLVADLDAYASGAALPFSNWEPRDDYVGAALIALASAKVPRRIAEQVGDEVSNVRRDAARRLIASHFFAFDADFYRILGARRTTPDDLLRKNYQRMMALVHPDSSPVGFPIDAAARANKAYATLSERSLRDVYDQSLAASSSTVVTAAPRVDVAKNAGLRGEPNSHLARIKRLLPTLGFRKGLIALGAGMLFACGLGLYQLMSSESHVVLVEARPRLAQSVELSSSAPIVETPVAQLDGAVSTVPPSQAAAGVPSLSTPLRLTTELRKTVADKPTTRQKYTPADPAVIAPVETATVAIQPPNSVSGTKRVADGPSVNAARTESASQMATEWPAQTTAPPVRDERSAADIDALLAQFASAFEAGSLSAMKQSFSTSMNGRNAVLADYERVFQSTKQRNIYFSKMRHNPLSAERVMASGIATVATVDLENRSVRQRVFLEIEISREAAGARISRIANYEQP